MCPELGPKNMASVGERRKVHMSRGVMAMCEEVWSVGVVCRCGV